jgi:hypothetical protein
LAEQLKHELSTMFLNVSIRLWNSYLQDTRPGIQLPTTGNRTSRGSESDFTLAGSSRDDQQLLHPGQAKALSEGHAYDEENSAMLSPTTDGDHSMMQDYVAPIEGSQFQDAIWAAEKHSSVDADYGTPRTWYDAHGPA